MSAACSASWLCTDSAHFGQVAEYRGYGDFGGYAGVGGVPCLGKVAVPVCSSPASSSEQRSASMQQWDRYVDSESGSLEDITREMAPELVRSLRKQVWELSKSARYCRLVQHALEITDEVEQVSIVSELKTRVIEATMDPHANHVLQRAIELMRLGAVKFILDELMEHKRGAVNIAKHRYGCRVLERVMEHFPPKQIADMVNNMMVDAKYLIGHQFGNFVMQHLLEHGEEAQRRQLVAVIGGSPEDLRSIAVHQHACSVLDKALSYVPVDDQRALALLVLNADGLLVEMASQRGGVAATQRLFKVIENDPELLQQAKAQLWDRRGELLTSKHGRVLAAQVLPELLKDQQLAAGLPSPGRSVAGLGDQSALDRFGGGGAGGGRGQRHRGGGQDRHVGRSGGGGSGPHWGVEGRRRLPRGAV